MKVRINLGCGYKIYDDWINVDISPQQKEVIKCDFDNEKLPFKDEYADELLANDVLEHLRNLIPFMNECHRVIKKDGIFRIKVPKFPHKDSVADPTHVRFFVPDTFKYFEQYEGVAKQYNILPWNIRSLEESENRIKVVLEKK